MTPTKEQVETFIGWAVLYAGPAQCSEPWVQPVIKHLREWVAGRGGTDRKGCPLCGNFFKPGEWHGVGVCP